MNISLFDLVIIILFLIVTFWLGIKERTKISLEDYWVNARKTNKLVLTATMLSTFIGASTIISIAGIAYTGGMAALIIGASIVFWFIIYSQFFAPYIKRVGDKLSAYTLPEVLGVRYDNKTRVAAALVNLIFFASLMAVQFIALGAFLSLISGLSIIASTIIGAALLIAYVSIGGLRADIRTDIFQAVVMLVLVFIFLPMLIAKSGGLGMLGELPKEYLTGTAFADPFSLLAGFLLIGLTVFVSQDVWQRTFAASDEGSAKKGMLWSALLMVLFFILAAAIGMFGKIILPNVDPNSIISEEFFIVLPIGLLGLGIAGFLAALMSSADTSLLVVSQALTHDLYSKRETKTDEEVLKITRWTTLIVGLVALILALVIMNVVHLAIEAISIQMALIPAVIGGFFWKKSNATAAFWSIIVGVATTFAISPFYPEEAFIPGFFVSLIVFVAASLLSKKSVSEKNIKISIDST